MSRRSNGSQVIEQAIARVFQKELYTLPRDMFLAKVKATYPIMCNNQGKIIWVNLHHVLSSLSREQLDIIRAEGLPAEAGTTAVPSPKQISGLISEMMKFFNKAGMPQPGLMTVSDRAGLYNQTLDLLASNLQYTFGKNGILYRPEPDEAEVVDAAAPETPAAADGQKQQQQQE
eukprot:NODE_2300_length_804_cov_249.426490_g1598_i0.p1 GENE.NODE_2300_length_804_cov_249.426490_g1598_i0~~NODE_2300_length_804_cov_249.426490_g1598_i0.p1  ORF type:complete len:174 (-),score=63.13 NODE_2300_length_804_cov_249.426490_g1598_i0:181-702(-)